jgi:hypothetical protein
VSERVVDLFEVDVEVECGRWQPVAPLAGQHLLSAVRHEDAIGQPGQGIVQSLILQLFVGLQDVTLGQELTNRDQDR